MPGTLLYVDNIIGVVVTDCSHSNSYHHITRVVTALRLTFYPRRGSRVISDIPRDTNIELKYLAHKNTADMTKKPFAA
jgi:hypothetical protein